MTSPVTIEEVGMIVAAELRGDLPDSYHLVRVVLKNGTASTTYYVTADLRTIAFDATAKRLSLGMAGKKLTNAKIGSFKFRMPDQVAIEPGASVELRLPVAKQFHNIDTSARRGQNTTVIDAADVREIDVAVTYDDTPFRLSNLAVPSLHQHAEFADWGLVTTRRVSLGDANRDHPAKEE